MSVKIGFISLGCPKNEVDAERMLYKLTEAGFELVDVPYEADVVIINTCAFIDDAKQEAIDNILEMAELKKDGSIRKIIVTGCLAERYQAEVRREMPEVDAVLGLGCNGDIVDAVRRVMADDVIESFPPKTDLSLEGERLLTSPPYWAYLKIAEGCSNACSYCIIPSIRGPYRSRDMESIVAEAETLARGGVKELVVVAQDTTRYGQDLYGRLALPELLEKLNAVDGIAWIRLLYCYPERVTDELLDAIARLDKVLPYIDLPLQHADGGVLKAMRRVGDEDYLLDVLARIRAKLPDCVLRTTLIAGFPGETEAAFETLCDFVEKARFDRLGCFAYSAEDGTPAAAMPDQIDDETKRRRGEIVMEQQFRIFTERQESLIGSTVACMVEGYDGYSDSYYGRSWRDAPEIDSAVYFTALGDYEPGDIVDVLIMDARDYDLYGKVV